MKTLRRDEDNVNPDEVPNCWLDCKLDILSRSFTVRSQSEPGRLWLLPDCIDQESAEPHRGLTAFLPLIQII